MSQDNSDRVGTPPTRTPPTEGETEDVSGSLVVSYGSTENASPERQTYFTGDR